MSEQDGLIGAYILDGKGGGRELDWPTLEQGVAADDRLWVHLDRNGEKSEDWLRMKSGLGQLQADALCPDAVRIHGLHPPVVLEGPVWGSSYQWETSFVADRFRQCS